jgi:hypothetical protein
MKIRSGLLAVVAGVAVITAQAADREEEDTSVFAKVFNGYTRVPSELGGYKAETFAFANGGLVRGRTRDLSVDNATFKQVVQLISPGLTQENYIAANNPDDTDLLIYVYWGATEGYGGISELPEGTAEMAADLDNDWYGSASLMDDSNRQRDLRAFSNAGLLGYREALAHHINLQGLSVHGTIYSDLIGDVEEPRYFVVLTAFDFKTAWKEKKLIPLWSTRYNIATRGNNFAAALPDMTRYASRFFGRESDGLVRGLNPTGKVNMGDIQILGAVATPAAGK